MAGRLGYQGGLEELEDIGISPSASASASAPHPFWTSVFVCSSRIFSSLSTHSGTLSPR